MYPVQQPFSCKAPIGWLRHYEKEQQKDRGQGPKKWWWDFQPQLVVGAKMR